MDTHGYTKEELESLFKYLTEAIVRVQTPVSIRQEEDDLVEYIRNLRNIFKTSEPISLSINDTFNETAIKQPAWIWILTDPVEDMPLQINHESFIIRAIAIWRLKNMK